MPPFPWPRSQRLNSLLIGNGTIYDRDLAALTSIFAEWTSSDSFHTWVNKLRNGLGLPRLDSSTILEDHARDFIFGGGGLDWIITND